MSYNRIINSIEHWKKAEDYLLENGYSLWQMQYDINSPEGFHARFYVESKPDIEIATYRDEVYKAIMNYGK